MANKKAVLIFIAFLFNLVLVSADSFVYDDFSGGSLDINKWEIRQDIEGQPFMEEFGVVDEGGNFVFHTKQNTIGDQRVTLVPKHNFSAGESFEYDVNYISGTGNRGHIFLLITTEFPIGNYIRAGVIGFNNGPDVINDFGVYHIKLDVHADHLDIIRTTPSNDLITHTLLLSNPNAKYKFYIETWSGHNGNVHIDYDNFIINTTEVLPPPPQNLTNLTARVETLEQEVAELREELEEQGSLLSTLQDAFNSFVDFITDLLSGLPTGLRQQMVCNTLEEGENATTLGLFCQNVNSTCSCSKV